MMSLKWIVLSLLGLVVSCGASDDTNNDATAGANGTGTGGTTGASSATGTVVASTEARAIRINEVVPSNSSGATDESGAYPDWVELYNPGSAAVTLGGLYLSDDPTDPVKAQLDASLTIQAGGVLVFWADGDTDQGSNHLSFNLSAAGEGVYVFDSSSTLLDRVEWTAATTDTSYARNPDGTGTFSWCATPTPNALNGATCGG